MMGSEGCFCACRRRREGDVRGGVMMGGADIMREKRGKLLRCVGKGRIGLCCFLWSCSRKGDG